MGVPNAVKTSSRLMVPQGASSERETRFAAPGAVTGRILMPYRPEQRVDGS
jgi:hypothetical protein